ncbi:MAG: undecaprenyldiphospho-muramoylpentapeptide beta-N-acetylglucosaminyltransferase [Lutibacter sp.]|uniref:undecaprenyldiphospho-muramoylpentapeptide beta-N-acetylglucosaminyltransferase n=1 Tax=Lutibacter sp. TaxID=1925666 RepID=UPI0018007C9A|nr:undecaprenyldiphospho-muramoylpentapeptide beta-N-acetylglucosaminyltransferase [Lutibacter sp.]MBT8316394.1 undecaprenyldiphospho-muramoylpentapeptide beta-N-acetylglucosaminyltransferase [Lutibacter sp.]NNJ57254.1 undecaprenyldiphospho-muramoylpentapeptide beta-N-acetylglucosaminyltransferase [Lutibacter sp.]
MKQSVNIILSGGGTGGHIYPAVSIANELKVSYPEAKFLFVGAKDRMEMEKVPQSGYDIKGLWISGIQRKLTLKNLSFPFKLISSLWNAHKIIKKFKPSIVIGTGGFASGPTLFMANRKGIKTLIQEQNSYPGITNKLLSKKADKICVAYDGLERFFPSEKIIKTGNPVRQDLLTIEGKKEEAKAHFKLDIDKKTLVIIGGSLGARAVNNLIEKHIKWLVSNKVQVIWQTGKLYYDEFKKYDELEGVKTYAFLNRMDLTYAAADFLISRAGASSISELCIVGKPVIFIPSPNVAEDHQTKNALAVVTKDAALLLKQSELNMFQTMFSELLNDEQLQKKLSDNIKKLALPNATKNIVKEIEKLLIS